MINDKWETRARNRNENGEMEHEKQGLRNKKRELRNDAWEMGNQEWAMSTKQWEMRFGRDCRSEKWKTRTRKLKREMRNEERGMRNEKWAMRNVSWKVIDGSAKRYMRSDKCQRIRMWLGPWNENSDSNLELCIWKLRSMRIHCSMRVVSIITTREWRLLPLGGNLNV